MAVDMSDVVIETMDDDMATVIRGKTPAERLRIAWGMWLSAQSMLTRLVRSQNPEWTDNEVGAEVARRLSSGS